MRNGRTFRAVIAVAIAGIVFLAAAVQFLAPDLAYAVKDRAAEIASGDAGKTYRLAAGSRTGSGYLVGAMLNRYLAANDGYELDLTSLRAHTPILQRSDLARRDGDDGVEEPESPPL